MSGHVSRNFLENTLVASVTSSLMAEPGLQLSVVRLFEDSPGVWYCQEKPSDLMELGSTKRFERVSTMRKMRTIAPSKERGQMAIYTGQFKCESNSSLEWESC